MKGFGIYVKNDLLDPKHYSAMREAIWLYLWLLDKITSVSEDGVGKVLGGRPVTSKEIIDEIGCSDRTYRVWLSSLAKGGYINKLRAPYGIVITVNKAVKPFKRSAVNGREIGSKVYRDRQNTADVIKTIQDNNNTIQRGTVKKNNESLVSLKDTMHELGLIS